jgi:protein-S-isoprenylcysteine O-methyltransferase Ste14
MYSQIVILCLWSLFVLYWLVSAAGVKKSVNRPWKGTAVRVLIVIALYAYFRSRRSTVSTRAFVAPSLPLAIAGIAICIFGIGLAIWARRHIGRNWGMPMSIKEEPELVDTGPYAHIRHPIYTGILIALIGSALVGGWWWGVMFVVFGAYFIYSARTEEKRLSQLMPTQYPAYMRRTKMLVPYIF